jgi:SAM-dependent methyltransferase
MREFLLDRLYAEFAWAYDLVSWAVSLGRWNGWCRAVLDHVRGRRVLEVGCGPGHLLPHLAQRAATACGIDPAPPMLRQARRRLRRAGLSLPLCRARAQALPYRAASFDTLLCTFPAGYIAEPATWAEFARVLAPGGRAVVLYGVAVGGRSLLRRLARGLLSLGRSAGAGLRPAWWAGSALQVEPLWVDDDGDRIGLLLAHKGNTDVTDAG